MKINKFLNFGLSMLLCVGIFSMAPVNAEEIQTNTVNKIEITETNNQKGENNTNTTDSSTSSNLTIHTSQDGVNVDSLITADKVLPDVSLEEAENKVASKTQELVNIFQKVLIYGCMFVFLIGAGQTLLGAFARKGGVGPGLWTMAISGIILVCVKYAADILTFFESWIIS